MAADVYLSLECPNCGEGMYLSLRTGIEHNGLPVIDLGMSASQVTFTCECGTRVFTSDFEDICSEEQ
jgi:hypothetical protein